MRIAMSTKASQSQTGADSAQKTRPEETQIEDQELYRTLSRLHREQLRPVGPIEQTLVETIVHNCYQIHHIQHAEREVILLHNSQSLINLGRLARYRDFLERSTREALAQLSDVQQRRRLAKPAVMAASMSAFSHKPAAGPQPVRHARSTVCSEPSSLPIPHPIDQPDPPQHSAATPVAPAEANPVRTGPGPYSAG